MFTGIIEEIGAIKELNEIAGSIIIEARLVLKDVKKGDTVNRGQGIGTSGNSGRSTAPHLHYEIRIQGRSVNPVPYILDSYASRN